MLQFFQIMNWNRANYTSIQEIFQFSNYLEKSRKFIYLGIQVCQVSLKSKLRTSRSMLRIVLRSMLHRMLRKMLRRMLRSMSRRMLRSMSRRMLRSMSRRI